MQGVRIIKFLDRYLGSLICLILSFFSSKKELAPEKILVIQLWGVGESVLTLPAIFALRKRFPDASISILMTDRNKDVYYKNRSISSQEKISLNPFSIICFIARNFRKYDLVIDMEEYLNISAIMCFFVGKMRVGYSHGSRSRLYTRTVKYDDAVHASQAFADLLMPLNVKVKVKTLEGLPCTGEDKKHVEKILKGSNYACVAPGAAESAKSRMWPKRNFALLADRLSEKYTILFTGSQAEKSLCTGIISMMKNKDKAINLAGKLTLRQLFCLVKRCSIAISNDTGTMHIAASQNVRTIGLFGPNLPVRFGPLNKKSSSIYKKGICKYSPCINVHRGEVPDCYYKASSDEYQKCMKAIAVEDVVRLSLGSK